MRRVLMTALSAAAAMAVASPALADVNQVAASSVQGTLVHGTGTETTGTTVTGDLGSNGPNIVNFDAVTTAPNPGPLANELRLQDGGGQADVTGAEITLGGTPNDVYNILSGNIYLTGHAGMQDIEFAFTSGVAGTVNFVVTALSALNAVETFTFNNVDIGKGDTFYAFLASNGETITNLHYSVNSPPGEITLIKQVRIDLAGQLNSGVPEPATWMMMLLGFGGMGMALRRSRRRSKPTLMQIA